MKKADKHIILIQRRESGATIVFVVALTLIVGVLGAGVYSITTTSSYTGLQVHQANRAQYLARSGLEFARHQIDEQIRKAQDPENPDPIDLLSLSGEYTVTPSGKFILEVSKVVPWDQQNQNYVVVSRGVTHGGDSQREANFIMMAFYGNDPLPDEPGYYVTYSGGGGDYALPSGGTVEGSVYSETVDIWPNSVVTGNIFSSTSVTLRSGVTVGGIICSSDGEVRLRSTGVSVGGEIHAWGDVILESGTTARDNIFSTGSVSLLSSNAQALKDIHAGLDVTMSSQCLADQDVYSGGSLTMRNSNSRVSQDVHTGGDVDMQNNTFIYGSAWVGGTINRPGNVSGTAHYPNEPVPPRMLPASPMECPVVPKPQMQTFTAGGTSTPGTEPLPPGSYTDLSVSWNAARTLVAGSCKNVGEPGCYYFTSISGGGNQARLRLDLSAEGEITVFVVGDIRYSGPVEISTDGLTWTSVRDLDLDTGKLLAKRVYWETHDNFEITSTAGTAGRQWFGTVLVKNNIELASGARIIGALATVDGNVSSGANPAISYSLADFAKDHW